MVDLPYGVIVSIICPGCGADLGTWTSVAPNAKPPVAGQYATCFMCERILRFVTPTTLTASLTPQEVGAVMTHPSYSSVVKCIGEARRQFLRTHPKFKIPPPPDGDNFD